MLRKFGYTGIIGVCPRNSLLRLSIKFLPSLEDFKTTYSLNPICVPFGHRLYIYIYIDSRMQKCPCLLSAIRILKVEFSRLIVLCFVIDSAIWWQYKQIKNSYILFLYNSLLNSSHYIFWIYYRLVVDGLAQRILRQNRLLRRSDDKIMSSAVMTDLFLSGLIIVS